jgi:hypothetical protein
MSLGRPWWSALGELRWESSAPAAVVQREIRESLSGQWAGYVAPALKQVIGRARGKEFKVRANTWPYMVARPWLVGLVAPAGQGTVVTARFAMGLGARVATLLQILVSVVVPFYVFVAVRNDTGDAIRAIPIAMLSGLIPAWTLAGYWMMRGDEYTLRQWLTAIVERAQRSNAV